MKTEWDGYIKTMSSLLQQLTSKELRPLQDCGASADKGVYVFYERGKPVYTGRTNNLKNRLCQHFRPSSGHNSATFAFNIAKLKASKMGIEVDIPRKQLETTPAFSKLYLEAKRRVSKMHVRFIAIDDPIAQTLFEVYASLALNTMKFNSFDNH